MKPISSLGKIRDARYVTGPPERSSQWLMVENDDFPGGKWVATICNNVTKELIDLPAWLPLPGSQMDFLSCPIREALYHGGRGFGKTETLLMDFARDVGKGHGSAWRGVLFRNQYKDFGDLKRKLIDTMPKLFPDFEFKHANSDFKATWGGGEELLLRAGSSLEDYDSHHGQEYAWIGYDELSLHENSDFFLKMFSCNRVSKPGVPLRIRGTTNPYGVGKAWVKRRYGLPNMSGRIIREEKIGFDGLPYEVQRTSIFGHVRENFVLTKASPGYVADLRQAAPSPAEAAAWIDGSWDVAAGGMFDDLWNSGIHVASNFSPKSMPSQWKLYRSYDHGETAPFSVGFWAVSDGTPMELPCGRIIGQIPGDTIRFAEWYGAETNKQTGKITGLRMTSKDIAKGILERISAMNLPSSIAPGPADTQIFTSVADRGHRSIGDDMEDVGLFWNRADKRPGSRKAGYSMIRQMLSAAIPSASGFREEPGLFIADGCHATLQYLPEAPRCVKDPDELPLKYEDHVIDDIRYMLSYKPPVMTRRSF